MSIPHQHNPVTLANLIHRCPALHSISDDMARLSSSVVFPATAASAVSARRHTRSILTKWNISLPSREVTELLVTELVTNAIKVMRYDEASAELNAGENHWAAVEAAMNDGVDMSTGARRSISSSKTKSSALPVPQVSDLLTLRLSIENTSLVIEVWDNNPRPPQLQFAEPTSEGGRGLQIVDMLCSGWGWYWPYESPNFQERGKVVWCTVTL
jgi:two-component sensor histidine kinase